MVSVVQLISMHTVIHYTFFTSVQLVIANIEKINVLLCCGNSVRTIKDIILCELQQCHSSKKKLFLAFILLFVLHGLHNLLCKEVFFLYSL